MRAVAYTAPLATLELVDLPDPACPADGVVVRVAATGLCRSDWHAWAGHDPVPLPMVPGHELAGVVVETGPQVRSVRPGRRVTVPFVCGCGRCAWCRSGDAQVCPDQEQPGFTIPGSFAEFVALPAADTNLVPLPDDIDDLAAAALGCRYATAHRALTAHGRLQPGQQVLVLGCGGVGLSTVQLAVALGADVVATDVNPAARALARTFGARTHDPAGQSPAETAAALRDLTGGGAHLSVDAIGSPDALQTSVRALRRRGRHVQVGLLLGPDAQSAVPMDLLVAHELSVHGSHGMPAVDYPALLHLISERRLAPQDLVTATIDLAQAPAALMAMGGPATRPGITMIRPG